MSTLEQKALAACARYVVAQAEVKRLTGQIGDALLHCPLNTGDGSVPSTHLRTAYSLVRQQEWLLETCQACASAYCLIEQRKAARVRFGVAKAAITRIGRETPR